MEVEASDVIKLILQFCHEHKLRNTERTLSDEAQVSLNFVDNFEKFSNDVLQGKWDIVLNQLGYFTSLLTFDCLYLSESLKISPNVLVDLYELVIFDLCELKDFDVARSFFHSAPIFSYMKTAFNDRFKYLNNIVNNSYFEYSEVYQEVSKENRRKLLLSSLTSEFCMTSSSRLMVLLNYSLKWLQYTGGIASGSRYDLFNGNMLTEKEVIEDQSFPTRNDKIINFGGKSGSPTFILCAIFTPDNQFLITGSSDGFIELYDYRTGKLRKDLAFQAEDDYMMHEDSVIALSVSLDSEYLASGGGDGTIKIWRILTGKTIQLFKNAHGKGITALILSTGVSASSSATVVSSSFDSLIRIHGLKSGRLLKQFRGHSSYVFNIVYNPDQTKLISISSDGFIKIWNTKSTECLYSIKPFQDNKEALISLTSIIALPMDRYVVSNQSNIITMINSNGSIIKTFTSNKPGMYFVSLCASSITSPKYLYAVGSDSILYCFLIDSGTIQHLLKLHEKEVIGVVHQHHQNVLASFSRDSTLKIWRP